MKHPPLTLNYVLQVGCPDTTPRTPWDHHPELRNLNKGPILDSAGRMRTIYMRIETVNVCNNDCIICAYGDQSRPKKRMSEELFKKVLDDYKEMGGGYVSITPLVGDVFMDPELDQRIAYLRSCDWVTGIGFTTNAVMAHRLSDEKLRGIVTSLKSMSISIYGIDEEEYEAMTRKKTYRQMIESIRRILSFAPFPVIFSFRALKKRTNTEVLNWLKTEFDINPQDIGQERGRHRIEINSFIDVYGNWGIYNDDNRPLPFDAEWRAFQPQPVRPQCMIPILAFMVFSSGNVSFCNCDNFDDASELRLGNVNEDSLSNIYNNAKTRGLWNWAQNGVPKFCQGCSFHIPMGFLYAQPQVLTHPEIVVGAG